jgi:hypothetical protein
MLDVTPIPVGSAILHIGPHKTGTTAVQHAMRLGRDDLLAQGVRLAGRGAGDGDGARHALGLTPTRTPEEARAAWERITADLADESVPRRIFSKETFANAGDRRARRLVDQLRRGSERLHVVISVRPLAELIPSQYSQFVQRGLCTTPFEQWCEAVLSGDTEDRSVRLFWKRHSHDEQVRRWGGLVGFENTTVVVVDRSDPLFLPWAFEQLLDLRPGTLVDRIGHSRGNRSLTLPELELVRQWHELTAQTGAEHGKVVRLAWKLCQHLRRFDPDPAAARVTMSASATERADDRAAASAASIRASGARVVGELEALSAAPVAG